MDKERSYFNQTLFFHKDIYYNSNSSLDISLTTSTTDLEMFSSPSLNLSVIQENSRKVCTLHYPQANDLVDSFRNIVETLSNKSTFPIEIYRKIGDKALKIVLKNYMDSKDLISDVSVIYNDSDIGRVVLPFKTFFSVMNIIKEYVNSYIMIGLNFSNRVILRELMNNSIELKNNVKTLPSYVKENLSVVKESIPSKAVEELDSFMSSNLDNIKIPELLTPEPAQTVEPEPDSKFVKNVLKFDIKVLEDVINSAMANRYFSITNLFKKEFEGKDLLPGISDNEMKSINYIGRLIFGSSLYKYVSNKVPFPQTVPVIKYEVKGDVHPDSLELAYDLLTISGFLKFVRNRLEARTTDAMNNKSFLYVAYRCFTDPYCFSFLEGKNVDTVKSIVLSRFRYFQKNSFFSKFEEHLKNYNVPLVIENDIRGFVDEICSKVLNNRKFIEEVHIEGHKGDAFKVPFVNSFSLEQIINEVVPIEIACYCGLDITKDEELKRVVDVKTLSKEVLDTLRKGKIQEPKKKKNPDEKETNIYRFVNFYKAEVPEKFRDKFLSYIKALVYGPCDLTNPDFPLEELGEPIVKGLYIWNETENKQGLYTDFYVSFENTIMTKDLIISKVRGSKSGTSISSGWADSFLQS